MVIDDNALDEDDFCFSADAPVLSNMHCAG